MVRDPYLVNIRVGQDGLLSGMILRLDMIVSIEVVPNQGIKRPTPVEGKAWMIAVKREVIADLISQGLHTVGYVPYTMVDKRIKEGWVRLS
jgi:hypothetical protein